MGKYLLQLGHCPDLSYAEIIAVSQRLTGLAVTVQRIGDAAIVEFASDEQVRSFCEELGGTIRAAQIFYADDAADLRSIPTLTPERLLEVLLAAHIDQMLIGRKKRPIFGISILDSSEKKKHPHVLHSLINDATKLLKDHLRANEVSSRFIAPDPQSDSGCLSGAQVEKNGLLEEGMEILLHVHPQTGVQIAGTIWLQHYEEYSHRDYGRPGRDSHSGMLPPKLARILINLARDATVKTILDPFCGSGGVVSEAGMMGLQATGFDNSQKAVDDTAKNWEWLQANAGSPTGELRAFLGDARQLRTLCEPLFFDACATEPYLGPPTNRPLDPLRFDALAKELIPLYLRALGEIRTVVKPGARVVFIVPRFCLTGDKPFGTLALMSEMRLQGYTILDPLSDFSPSKSRTTLIYSRPKQVVQREIFVLKA